MDVANLITHLFDTGTRGAKLDDIREIAAGRSLLECGDEIVRSLRDRNLGVTATKVASFLAGIVKPEASVETVQPKPVVDPIYPARSVDGSSRYGFDPLPAPTDSTVVADPVPHETTAKQPIRGRSTVGKAPTDPDATN